VSTPVNRGGKNTSHALLTTGVWGEMGREGERKGVGGGGLATIYLWGECREKKETNLVTGPKVARSQEMTSRGFKTGRAWKKKVCGVKGFPTGKRWGCRKESLSRSGVWQLGATSFTWEQEKKKGVSTHEERVDGQ